MTRLTRLSILVVVSSEGMDGGRPAAVGAEMCALEGREPEFRVGCVAAHVRHFFYRPKLFTTLDVLPSFKTKTFTTTEDPCRQSLEPRSTQRR